ncbi:MAG: hypothetical protein WBP45_04785, partial [Daejeonella sp.]
MPYFSNLIKGDYRQRTRSYAFLVSLAISLYIAYTFVPAPDAGYYTVRVGNFRGDYNSAWIACVTAMLTSTFLSLIGFFLVNNSVKKDIETEVGMIIAATPVSNFKYLLSKTLSNFLVLLSMTTIIFLMSIALFFMRARGYSFEISQYVLPYLLVTLPCLFFISTLAIIAEVFLGRRPVFQYLGFFLVCNLLFTNMQMAKNTEISSLLDPFGVKYVMKGMEEQVKTRYDKNVKGVSMGFVFGSKNKPKTFQFEGVQWSAAFIVSRILWMSLGILLVLIASRFFHRFDVKERVRAKKKSKFPEIADTATPYKDIKILSLPPVAAAYGILPFIKTELLMLFRKGSTWFWFLNLLGMLALIFTPISVAHQLVLPVLWFLQVGRWSDLSTKEKTNRIHYFSYASYQPLKRLLSAQLIAGIILALALASPLLLRYLIAGNFLTMLS